jgi:hypothetical protein
MTILLANLETVDRASEARQAAYRRFSVWFPFAVYAVSRVWVLIAGTVTAKTQMALPVGIEYIRITFPVPADPGYWAAMTNWDGQWYRIIAEQGYPQVLPRIRDGSVDMNPWAFFPVFPTLVGLIMKVTGLPFIYVGPALSLVIGFFAMHLLFKLVDRAVGRFEAVVVVVATCFYIASPVFSASYTESLALLLVVAILLLLRARQYVWVVPLLLVLSLTRNIVIAMVPVILAHAVVRWRTGDEGEHPVRLRVGLGGLAAYAALLTFLWPTIVGVSTGVDGAYEQTMLAWKIKTSIKLYMWWNLLYDYGGWWWQAVGVLGVAAFAWFMLSRHSWRWGPEIWGWAGGYPAYIILVTSTTPSRVRYAILAFPMALILAWFLQLKWWREWRWYVLASIVVIGAVQMWWWTEHYLIIANLTDDLYP